VTGTPARVPGARRLYVRMPNWIGDVVMATPTIRALKAAYPEASITLGMRAWSAETLSGWDEVDATWVVPEGEANPFGGLFPYVRKLKEARFDVAILLTNSFGTALGPALAGIPTRVGYDGDLRGPLLSRRIPKRLRKTPQPTPALYARIAEAVGA
jgi:heptosyltransferase II